MVAYNNLILDNIEAEFYKYDLSQYTLSKQANTSVNYDYLKSILNFSKEIDISVVKFPYIKLDLIDETVDCLSSNCQAKVEINQSGNIQCSCWKEPIQRVIFYFKDLQEFNALCKFCNIQVNLNYNLTSITNTEIDSFKKEFKSKQSIKIYYYSQRMIKRDNFVFFNSTNSFKTLYNNTALIYSLDKDKLISGVDPKDELFRFIYDILERGIVDVVPLIYFQGGYKGLLSCKRPLVANFLNYDVLRLAFKQGVN